ncbi:MAG: AAA family ATPase [Bryobacterales bacterium]|nr:AAA family ATPase [Bryobacterales bacterium]
MSSAQLPEGSRPTARPISTGITGLDDVLAGGLRPGHLYLFDGDPGTGKTTLGLQFLLAGVQAGERVLHITLSESERELRQVAASHGWPLDGVDIFELLPMEESLKVEEQYTVLYPGEVELSETLKAILKRVEEVRPKRVVFDSLSELRLLAREQLRFRRQVLALKQYFSGRDCTVLLLDDRTAGEDERDLQSIVHCAVRLENLAREYGSKRRRVEVLKYRGVKFREGYHDYSILTGGLELYPRLVASEHRRAFWTEVVKSGVPELDTLLGGGLNPGTSTLVIGPAGAGKSTICFQYAVAAAERGQDACFLTFDEDLAMIRTRMAGLGVAVDPLLESGKLTVEVIDPSELSPGHFTARCRHRVQEGTKLLVIDSLNGLLAAMPSEEHLLMQLRELLSFLNNQGVTTLIVMAQYGILGQGMASPIDLSHLADTVLLLRYFEAAGEVCRAMSVVKKRSGRHERTIRELRFSSRGIHVGRPLHEFQGILTGVPTYVGAAGPLLAGTGDAEQR